MQKWEQSFPLARLQRRAELTVSLSSGQEQLGKPVLPARRILPGPDAFANPSPAAMCSGTGSSLLCCGIARGFQQAFICKTHPWISLKFRGKGAPEGLWGVQMTKVRSRLSRRCGGAAPRGRGGGSTRGMRRCLPRAPPPAADVVTVGTRHQEHTEVVFFQEAKATRVLFLKW